MVRFVVKTPTGDPIPDVSVRVLDASGILAASGTTDGFGYLDLDLVVGSYSVWYSRGGYARPSAPYNLEVPADEIILSSGWPDPLIPDQSLVLIGSGFESTPADNIVRFTTEIGTIDKAGADVSMANDVLVVTAPSAVELGAVAETSVLVIKSNPTPPPAEIESNTITLNI
jgi:hypothetical protein